MPHGLILLGPVWAGLVIIAERMLRYLNGSPTKRADVAWLALGLLPVAILLWACFCGS